MCPYAPRGSRIEPEESSRAYSEVSGMFKGIYLSSKDRAVPLVSLLAPQPFQTGLIWCILAQYVMIPLF